MKLIDTLKHARRVSVPLVAITTPDPSATIKEVLIGLNNDETRYVAWDAMRGLHEPNDAAKYGLKEELLGGGADATVLAPMTLLGTLYEKMPPKSICFMHMADRFWRGDNVEAAGVTQGIKNLRDLFKAQQAMLIMLTAGGQLPQEIKNDVLVIDEPLPAKEQIKEMAVGLTKEAKKASKDFALDGDGLERAAGTLEGLPMFTAEQAMAMSLRKSGVDFDDLTYRQRKLIEATPGLSVYAGPERFDDLGGVANVKTFLRRVIAGKRRPRVFVFIDEIEKSMGGSEHDTSGVSQDQLRGLLTHLQDRKARGAMFVGVAGSAKSALAKAAGNEAGVPTIILDLGGMKGSLVGQSEQQLRDALKVIDAVGGESAVWIATCNRIAILPPELRRRFTLGTFFFDLPSEEERDAIWNIYQAKHQLKKAKRPNDVGWTGAEIKQCCENAWDFGLTLEQAAAYVTPVSVSAADEVQRLRQTASGRFLSASRDGIYKHDDDRTTKKAVQERARSLDLVD